MADYLTTDTELTSIANAIRTKGGTSDPLEWPQGYVDAIDAIETGGGGVETATVAIYGVNLYEPTNICYTDSEMVPHVSTDGQLASIALPVGSLVACYGTNGPTPFAAQNIGVTAIYVTASPKSLFAVYEVTG